MRLPSASVDACLRRRAPHFEKPHLAEALRHVDATGKRRNEAELYRLQGELLQLS
jgi:hypothetical protein